MSDLIVKDAGEIKDGLYNIKDGKLFQYKANGGTVRTYPIVSADRQKGKWIIDNKEAGRIWHCHCSDCGNDPQDHIGGTENWWLVRLPKYCPNCGLPMRGDEE